MVSASGNLLVTGSFRSSEGRVASHVYQPTFFHPRVIHEPAKPDKIHGEDPEGGYFSRASLLLSRHWNFIRATTLFKRRPRADNTENRGKFASLSPIRRVFNRFRNLRANFFNQRPLAEGRRGKKRNPAHFSILLFSSSSEHPPLIEKFFLPFRLKLSPYLETSSHDKPRGLSLRVSPLVNV